MLTSLYFFGKKENGNSRKDVLFNIMDDPTDLETAIEEFANIDKEDAQSAIDGFVGEKNDD